MIALLGTVFVASLVGSLHCAGMCGGVLALCLGVGDEPETPTPSRFRLQAAYNLGRLVTYTILGGVAGAAGAALELGGELAGVQRAAAIVAGGLMILFGLIAALRACGVAINRVRLPAGVHRVLKAGYDFAFGLNPIPRAAIIGLLTGLLPCGWLWAFVIASSATASPWLGAAVMAAFWSGTLPVMLGLGVGLQALTGRLRRHLPTATALVLILVGCATLAGRLNATSLTTAHLKDTAAGSNHIEAARNHITAIDEAELPCCTDDNDLRTD